MIKNSEEIMNLLKRDNIKVEEVANYHIYPIADNDTPKLAADRLEYTLSNGLGVVKDFWSLDEVEEIYNNIAIYKNEDGTEELGFKDRKIAEKFVQTMSKLSKLYIENKNKYSMQFLADTIKKMSEIDLISKEDLYNLSEKEVIEKIENCDYDNISNCFKYWKNANKIDESDTLLKDKYCLSLKAKKRYIVPLVENNGEPVRINKISEQANEDINNFLNFETPKYAYLDFKF